MGKILAGLLSLALTAGAWAQEAQRHQNTHWYRAQSFRFTPAGEREAMQILRERIVPAAEKADIAPAILVEHVTGHWDLTLYFPMSGPDDLAYVVSPRDLAFRAALASLEDGMEGAAGVLGEFQSKIAETRTEIVRMKLAGTAGDFALPRP